MNCHDFDPTILRAYDIRGIYENGRGSVKADDLDLRRNMSMEEVRHAGPGFDGTAAEFFADRKSEPGPCYTYGVGKAQVGFIHIGKCMGTSMDSYLTKVGIQAEGRGKHVDDSFLDPDFRKVRRLVWIREPGARSASNASCCARAIEASRRTAASARI